MAQLTANQEKDIIDKFVHKLGGQARITGKRYQRIQPPRFYPDNFTDYHTIQYETIPVVELELPMDSFQKLAEDHHDLDNMRAHYGPNIDRLAIIAMQNEQQQRRERGLRAAYPGLQKAWENYQLMLKLVEGNNND